MEGETLMSEIIPNEKLARDLKDAPIQYSTFSPVVDMRKLALPHQLVSVRHTGEPIPNPQLVVDRYQQGHLLQPGEVKELDLLVSQIERFRELRRPGRMIEAVVQEGEIYQMKRVEAPLHPIMIEDLPCHE
jgi:hypothetical protein